MIFLIIMEKLLRYGEREENKMLLNHKCPICKKVYERDCTPEPNQVCFNCIGNDNFVIHWLEIINPQNACDELNINSFEIDSLENPDNYKKVLKEIKGHLPIYSKHSGELMGDWEFECTTTFKANDIEEAKMVACFDFDCEVFVVFDKCMTKLFDDSDCEDISQDTRKKEGEKI